MKYLFWAICFLLCAIPALSQAAPSSANDSQAQSAPPPTEAAYGDLVHRFDYDSDAPLDYKELGSVARSAVTLLDVSYASPRGGRVPAYLIVPKGKGPFAGVIFAHWALDGSPVRNRSEFLEEALVLARSGAVCLLPDAPFARPGRGKVRDPYSQQTMDEYLQQVLDLRRGVDLLLSRKDVDPKRLAYIGHSYSANVGGVLAGVDKRFKTLVLMAGTLSDGDDMRASQELRAKYGDEKLEQMIADTAWLDPANYVGHAAPASVLLQYARQDGDLNQEREEHYFSLVSDPKELKLYDSGHALNAQARADRAAWLQRKLALKAIDLHALAAVPQTEMVGK